MTILQQIKQRIRRTAARHGYTIAADWRAARLPQQRYLARLFAWLGIDCVIDVGANRGQFRDFLRNDVEYAGPIASFEPVPALAAELARRAQGDALWSVFPHALGSRAEVLPINVMADDPFSSFLQPTHAATTLFERSNRIVESIAVDVHTLDAVESRLQSAHAFARPYLKIDTQGFDQEVLRGATALLARTPALQFEASIVPIYAGAPDFVQSIRWLEDAGFVVSAIFPNNPEHFPRMIEFDCHMVRRELCNEPVR